MGRYSSWNTTKGHTWGYIVLTNVNDLLNGLITECKLFTDDTSLFSVFYDFKTSARIISKDLEILSDWDF